LAQDPSDLRRPTLGRLADLVVRPLQAFFRLEAASGVLLLAGAVAALVWANVDWDTYAAATGHELLVGTGSSAVRVSVVHVVNEGLMTLFFVVVGMEIKRELAHGELDSMGKAALPAVGAVGGMIVPAAIYLALNPHGPASRGWAIPMATDIAFSVGVLTLLRGRVPHALIVFVTALAIFDDIGGIAVIAFFYGHGIDVVGLAGAAVCVGALVALNRARVGNALAYAGACVALWYAMHLAGVHATLSGVAVGLAVPARGIGDEPESPLDRFEQALHPWVAFGIVPVFALVNGGVFLGDASWADLANPVTLGIAIGLFLGKTVGIFGATLAGVRARVATTPGGATKGQILGASMVAGIGFTVALFIAALAFADAPELLSHAKLGIILGSVASGILGFLVLRLAPPANDYTAA